MAKKFLSLAIAVVLSVSVLATGVSAAEYVVNGGAEMFVATGTDVTSLYTAVSKSSATTVGISTENARGEGNNKSFAISPTTSKASGNTTMVLRPNGFDAVEGTTYTISFDIFVPEDRAGESVVTKVAMADSVNRDWYFADGTLAIANKAEADVTGEITRGQWQTFTRKFTAATSGQSKINVTIVTNPATAGIVVAYVDNFSVKDASGMEYCFDGDAERISADAISKIRSTSTDYVFAVNNNVELSRDTTLHNGTGSTASYKMVANAAMTSMTLKLNVENFDATKEYVFTADVYSALELSSVSFAYSDISNFEWYDMEGNLQMKDEETKATTYRVSEPAASTWNTVQARFKPTTSVVSFDKFPSIAIGGDFAIGDSCYIDNISITEYTAPPVAEVFDVTITGENAVVSVAAATSEGEAVNFTVAPKFGYYIQSITIGGTPFNGFDAYKGGTYSTGAIAADTAIVVTTASYADNDKGVATDVATLPAVFAETGEAPVTFGKVLADVATVDEFGIYLTTAEGDEVESAVTKMGPHFKAFYNVGGQYAIEFQGLAAGEYIAKTYVKVAGVTTYGIATTFTVAE